MYFYKDYFSEVPVYARIEFFRKNFYLYKLRETSFPSSTNEGPFRFRNSSLEAKESALQAEVDRLKHELDQLKNNAAAVSPSSHSPDRCVCLFAGALD